MSACPADAHLMRIAEAAKPETLILKPETLILGPETKHLEPETLILEPETLDLYTVNLNRQTCQAKGGRGVWGDTRGRRARGHCTVRDIATMVAHRSGKLYSGRSQHTAV